MNNRCELARVPRTKVVPTYSLCKHHRLLLYNSVQQIETNNITNITSLLEILTLRMCVGKKKRLSSTTLHVCMIQQI